MDGACKLKFYDRSRDFTISTFPFFSDPYSLLKISIFHLVDNVTLQCPCEMAGNRVVLMVTVCVGLEIFVRDLLFIARDLLFIAVCPSIRFVVL